MLHIHPYYINIFVCIVDLYEPEGRSGCVPGEPHPRGVGLHLPTEYLPGVPVQPQLHHRRHLSSQRTGKYTFYESYQFNLKYNFKLNDLI